jgi:hypothetical protein
MNVPPKDLQGIAKFSAGTTFCVPVDVLAVHAIPIANGASVLQIHFDQRRGMPPSASQTCTSVPYRSHQNRLRARFCCRANGPRAFWVAGRLLEDKRREVTQTFTESAARLGKKYAALPNKVF